MNIYMHTPISDLPSQVAATPFHIPSVFESSPPQVLILFPPLIPNPESQT